MPRVAGIHYTKTYSGLVPATQKHVYSRFC